ncbi:hypothetical protein P12x_002620 [Tundrisphaera lichenicola]|uniref:hypothetical protein n=1 Tax=Tundrisphaera lichenicola TaxID=2029860 RepID=UPI003EB7A8EB
MKDLILWRILTSMPSMIETLKRRGILTRKGISKSAINKLTETKYVNLMENLIEDTRPLSFAPIPGTQTHAASLTLGGSRDGCSNLSCRMQRIDELARFAVMLSDSLYINNFITDYSHRLERFSENEIKESLFDDIEIILKLEPLLRAGLIQFASPPEHACPNCWSNDLISREMAYKLDQEEVSLANKYYEYSSISAEYLADEFFAYLVNCPEPYLEHGFIAYTRDSIPEPLASMPRLKKRLEQGEKLILSKNIRNKIGLHNKMAASAIKNITFEMTLAQLFDSSFVTSNDLHVNILNKIHNEPSTISRNAIAQQHLTSILPMLENSHIESIIKIRAREPDAFIQYRAALYKTIDEYRKSDTGFNKSKAKQLFSDVLEPRLVSLDQKLKQAQSDLLTNTFRSTVGIIGAISFGIYSGMIPSDLMEAAKSLGYGKLAIDYLQKLMAMQDARNGIKSDDLYFLWKVRKLGHQ